MTGLLIAVMMAMCIGTVIVEDESERETRAQEATDADNMYYSENEIPLIPTDMVATREELQDILYVWTVKRK